MSIDKELHEELRQVADSVQCPPEMYDHVRQSYKHYINEKRGRSPMKKRLLVGFAAAVILIPSAVYAASSYLADGIFGSFKAVEEKGATQEDYQLIEEMLHAVKGKLTEDEFKQYTELTKQLMQLKLKVMNENGAVFIENLTIEEQLQYEQISLQLAPYFEKIKETETP